MKKQIIASTLLLASTAGLADWEDVWRNPDLNTGVSAYQGGPARGYIEPTSTSLDRVSRQNPDLYTGQDLANAVAIPGFSGPTSLDVFVAGNADNYSGAPERGIVVDDRGGMLGQNR
ncbi:MAG TPA: hypothetical protein ENK26_11965 [Gammaproteobacteria bacterium]|nr:hypothetical protein [Gammaproteobacteria bacterium]